MEKDLIIVDDCRRALQSLATGSVRCIVTSPPYYKVRDYGFDKQIGLESTPEAFIQVLVEVFREARRVLADDGTLWVNMGDSYAAGAMTKHGGQRKDRDQKANSGMRRKKADSGLKDKDLIGIPWMLAFALRADGWFLRQDIIWHKPNPMPESATDRCTKAHEYIFLLSKSARYYYDQNALLEDCSPNTHARLAQNVLAQKGSDRAYGSARHNGRMKAVSRKYDPAPGSKNNPRFDKAMQVMPLKRNKRSVWTVTTKPNKEKHYATFPPELITPPILAGSAPGDIVLDMFAGTGTTGIVAKKLGRHYILIEGKKQYAAIAKKRFHKEFGLFNNQQITTPDV